MPGTASLLLILLLGITDHYQLGRAAMEAHDPAAAIAHFEQVDTQAGRAWLAVALMMESRSPSDRYVERAFEAAARSRSEHPEQVRSHAEIAKAIRPGEMVITFLVVEGYAYAWALDHDTLVGYPLPPPAQLTPAIDQVKVYVAQKDQAGVQRVAEDFVPALLGPSLDRLPSLTRVIFVMDNSMRQLPIGELPVGDDQARMSEKLAVSIVTDNALLDELARTPPAPTARTAIWSRGMIAGFVVALLLIAGAVVLRRRSSVA